ncbi:MAG: ABC transporter ATP-binding protein [Elusimicrobiales bacterium]|nr:ABC transporter ATP-binding protein [Elusimicrobiales bacterium]
MKISPEQKKLYTSLFSYLKPHKKRMVIAFVSMAVLAGIRGLIVYLVGPFIQGIFIDKNTKMVKILLIVLPILFIIRLLAEYINNYVMNYIGQKTVQQMREDIFVKIHELPMEFYWRSKTGDILSRVMNDIGNIQSAVQFIPLYGVRDMLTVIFVTFFLFYINFKLAIFSLVFLPFSLVALRIFGKKMRKYSRDSQRLISDVSNSFQESLGAIPIIKAYNYEDESVKKFRFSNQEYFNKVMKYLRATSLSGPVMEFIGSMVVYVLIFIGYKWIMSGQITAGVFFSFIAAFVTVYMPFKNISNMNSKLQIGMASWERIYSLLNEKKVVEVKNNPVVLKNPKGKIEFKNVYYKYPTSDGYVLNDINLVINPNDIVAFVGSSGSGKSTIIQLILRFFDPVKGQILIDDYDIRDLDLKSLREFMSIVTQDTIVFNDTIENNIRVGRLDSTEKDILEAIEVSDSYNFIKKMPQGLKTVIGEHGLKVSGGQKQRLAIARAVVRKPRILLLDEATSNLDSKSEEVVQKAIENVLKEKTVVMTAHRLSTVVNADQIFVLKNGEVVEHGKHDELIKHNGEYYNLYKKQNI